MSEENNLEPMDDELEDLDLDEYYAVEPAFDVTNDNLERFMAVASVEAVFGDPVEHGENLIIPVAEIGSAMGFGVGSGVGIGENQQSGSGAGGGGGGWNFSRPVAVVVVTPSGIRIEPVIDLTKIALAALTTAGFMIGMTARMLRPRR